MMKKDTENCIFCKMISGEVPIDSKMYEDNETFAFLSNSPVNKGHTLVIPKRHFANIYELPDEIAANMAHTTKKMAAAVKKATAAQGINILVNNDKAAGQGVFHIHFHVIPRFSDDGLAHWESDAGKYKKGEIVEFADKIKQSM